MKILPYEPGKAAGHGGMDNSRLGLHCRGINISQLQKEKHGIVLLGLADDTGIKNVGGRIGAKDGPSAARSRLYKFTTGLPKNPVYDLGDLLPEDTIEKTHEAAAEAVRSIISAGHFPIVIGGGHDLGFPHALGVLSHTRQKTLFCNIDAHLDVRPTDAGITSGSPWYLLRESELYQQTRSRIAEFGVQPHCNAHSLVSYAKQNKFTIEWLGDIRSKRKPADQTFRQLLGSKSAKERLLISLDIDSVQISDAPGCSAPQTLGFSPEEVLKMSFLAGSISRVDSFGIFELSPPLDPDGRTALLAAHCIRSCMEGYATRFKVKKLEAKPRSRG